MNPNSTVLQDAEKHSMSSFTQIALRLMINGNKSKHDIVEALGKAIIDLNRKAHSTTEPAASTFRLKENMASRLLDKINEKPDVLIDVLIEKVSFEFVNVLITEKVQAEAPVLN